MGRQKGIITEFDSQRFDPDADFTKIGKGSLGGKARGLAFMSTRLKNSPKFLDKFKDVNISVPKTLVVSTEGFDSFISQNNLEEVATGDFSDEEIIRLFTTAQVPEWLKLNLEQYLNLHPLSSGGTIIESARRCAVPAFCRHI